MSWDAFLRQYQAEGREKGDGYSDADFAGLTVDELARARAMMLERALAGDTVDLNGLRHIGDAETIAALWKAAHRDHDLGIDFEIARRETLFELTLDDTHLEPLFRHVDARDMLTAQRAAEALARHPLSSRFAGRIAARLMSGRHEAIKQPLIQAWLAARGVEIWKAHEFDRQLQFIRTVVAQPVRRRARLLAIWPDVDEARRYRPSRASLIAVMTLSLVVAAVFAGDRYLDSMPIGTGESRLSPDGRFAASIMDWSERSFLTGEPRTWFHFTVTGPDMVQEFTSDPIAGPYFGSRSSHRVIHWDEDSSAVEFIFPTMTLRIKTAPEQVIEAN